MKNICLLNAEGVNRRTLNLKKHIRIITTSKIRPNIYYNLVYNIHFFGEKCEGINPSRWFRNTTETSKLYKTKTHVSRRK